MLWGVCMLVVKEKLSHFHVFLIKSAKKVASYKKAVANSCYFLADILYMFHFIIALNDAIYIHNYVCKPSKCALIRVAVCIHYSDTPTVVQYSNAAMVATFKALIFKYCILQYEYFIYLCTYC